MAKSKIEKSVANRREAQVHRAIFNEMSDNVSIAFLDIGTKSGLVVADKQLNIIHIDAQDFTEFNGKTLAERGRLWFEYGTWLKTTFSHYKVAMCVFEDVRRNVSHDASIKFGGFKAVLQHNMFMRDGYLVPCPVRAGKIAMTGSGTADKMAMVKKAEDVVYNNTPCPSDFTHLLASEDVADALGLFQWYVGLENDKLGVVE